MAYGIIWRYEGKGSVQKLVSSPESLEASTDTEAKEEGRQILAELSETSRAMMKPLAVVEISEDMLSAISSCDSVWLINSEDDGELEFRDVTELSIWSNHAWWVK